MEAEWVQIIVCAQRMPQTTGVDFLKAVRSQWPDTLRIILSAFTDAEDLIAGVNEAGIYQYLIKPWQPEPLLLALQTAARGSIACSRRTSGCRSTCAPPNRCSPGASR